MRSKLAAALLMTVFACHGVPPTQSSPDSKLVFFLHINQPVDPAFVTISYHVKPPSGRRSARAIDLATLSTNGRAVIDLSSRPARTDIKENASETIGARVDRTTTASNPRIEFTPIRSRIR
jgi:hypothetical protein